MMAASISMFIYLLYCIVLPLLHLKSKERVAEKSFYRIPYKSGFPWARVFYFHKKSSFNSYL